LIQFATLEIDRSFPRQIAKSDGIVWRLQFRIVASRDAEKLVDHELALATLDPNLPDRPGHDARLDGFDHAVANTDCGAETLVDTFQSHRDVHPVSHHRIAQRLARADIADVRPFAPQRLKNPAGR